MKITLNNNRIKIVKEAVSQNTIDTAQQELYSILKPTLRYMEDSTRYVSHVNGSVSRMSKQYTLEELQNVLQELHDFVEGTIKELKRIDNEFSKIEKTLG